MELSNCRGWERVTFPSSASLDSSGGRDNCRMEGARKTVPNLEREPERKEQAGSEHFFPFFALLQPISSSLPR